MKIKYIFKGFVCIGMIVFLVSAPAFFEWYKNNKERVTQEDHWRGVIVMWDYPYFNKENGTRYGWISDKIKQFEKENKGVYIDFKPIEPGDALYEIKTAADADGLPDIAPIGGERSIHTLGILEPLNNHIRIDILDQYLQDVQECVSYNQNIYGIPKMINLHIIALNNSEFQKDGEAIPQDMNWSAEEFLKAAKSIYGKTDYPFVVNDAALLCMALSVNDLSELEAIQANGLKHTKNLISAFKKRECLAIGCSSMDLSKVEHRLGGYAQYDLKNYFHQGNEMNLLGDCIAYGILKQEDEEKLEMCIKLLHFLTKPEEENELYKYNAFSVIQSNYMYNKKSEIGQLEELTKHSKIIFLNTLTQAEKTNLMNMYEKTANHKEENIQ